VVGVSVVTHDITERKRMEDRLRQAQERFRVGLQNARIHVIELDRDLRYTWIYSPTGEFKRDLIVGKTSEELLRPDDAQRLTGLMRRVLETGHGAREFVEVRIGGQDQVFDLAVEPLRDGAGAVIGVTGAAADVTEFKRVEAELRAFAATLEDRVARRTEDLVRSQEALRQNERLAAIGQMMTGLSHESRNALQRSLACLELLEKTVRDNPRAHMLLSEAQRAQQDLKQVYEEVQAYAAPIRLEVADQDLAQCWREAWKDLAPVREGRHAELVEDLDGVQTLCPVDVFRMRQVFRNLFENALAAAEGPVVIRIRGCEGEINGIPCLRVEVQDNGPGIPLERAERIFEPFYTTKTKGTGLGLSIVRRIVEGHGGTIHARKASEGGLGLEIALPRQSKPAASVLSQSPGG
jgi:PAS domain S-box-containing protein